MGPPTNPAHCEKHQSTFANPHVPRAQMYYQQGPPPPPQEEKKDRGCLYTW